MKDAEGEKKFGIRLIDTLELARTADRRLFEGHTFYVTGAVKNNPNGKTYKVIAASAGAKVKNLPQFFFVFMLIICNPIQRW